MVTPVLRELAGPYPPLPFQEPWFLSESIVQHLTTAWEQICHRITQTGSAEELHATRDDYQTMLLGYLKILDGYLAVMSRFRGDDPDAELLNRFKVNRTLLQKHYDSLFPRWQTLDDLEAFLLERVSLPNEQLKELAAKYHRLPRGTMKPMANSLWSDPAWVCRYSKVGLCGSNCSIHRGEIRKSVRPSS